MMTHVSPASGQEDLWGGILWSNGPARILDQRIRVVAKNEPKKRKYTRIVLVGKNRKLKKPSDAARIARPGDLIKIDAGDYRDCAVWRAPNIAIEGVGGYAHVKDISCGGKAIWVFYAAPVRISNIRFSGARVPARNGAGIRWEGGGTLIVRHSWFHNNQMGILTHNVETSQLGIQDSKFEENGDCPDFCGHGVYAGRIRRLIVLNSEFTGHKHGHHIKSRAQFNRIDGNRISDGPTGTASFSIDLPESGTAVIRYNTLEKGPKSENFKAMISIGEEGGLPGRPMHTSRGIIIENNAFQNDNERPTIFIRNSSPHKVMRRNNRFSGPGDPLR